MFEDKKMIKIDKLYPTESIFSIDSEKIKKLTNVLDADGSNTEVVAIIYGGYYFIVQGHEQVAAASYLGAKQVMVYLMDYRKHSFYSKESNIESTLSSLGMTAIYDYEAICGITFSEYPSYYKK